MKKSCFLLLFSFIIISCNNSKSNDFLSLSGKLENNIDSLITIIGPNGVLKTIPINSDGTFKDTINVKDGQIYTFQTSRVKRAPIYLKNGYDLTLKGDANEFMSSFKFSGKGSDNSNFVIAQIEESRKIGNPNFILDLEEEAFNKKMESIKQGFDGLLTAYKDIDTSLVKMYKEQNVSMFNYFDKAYKENASIRKGKPSPKFSNYVDYKGGKKSLDSFKGKYVYIDIWATWCGPCIQQIPYLKKLEKEYHNKNIEFISISTDEARRNGGSWEAAEKKWRDFVKNKQLSGIQLWAGKDISFQLDYKVNGIPRFILVDPKGTIVSSNAPRPSDPSLKELFNSLGI